MRARTHIAWYSGAAGSELTEQHYVRLCACDFDANALALEVASVHRAHGLLGLAFRVERHERKGAAAIALLEGDAVNTAEALESSGDFILCNARGQLADVDAIASHGSECAAATNQTVGSTGGRRASARMFTLARREGCT